jgi:hypothetical protein
MGMRFMYEAGDEQPGRVTEACAADCPKDNPDRLGGRS